MPKQILKTDNRRLKDILQKSRLLQKLEDIALPRLPIEFQTRVKIASFSEGRLKFVVSSGMWATRLRYAFPDIMPKLKTHPMFKSLRQMDCAIVPEDFKPQAPPSNHKISAETAELLNDVASMTADPELSAALARLAKSRD